MSGTRKLERWLLSEAAHEGDQNPPGRAELHYRVGDYATFREVMIAALERVEVDPQSPPGAPTRPLAGANHDPRSNWMIALIDAWALVGDILTFYQERFINEGYLATAREELSIELLQRTLGRRRSGSTSTADAAIIGTQPASPTPPPATVEPVRRGPALPTMLGPAGPVFPTPGASTASPLPAPQLRSPEFGYRVDPGAAAVTDVVFRLVPHQATGGRVLIRAGTAIRSHRVDGRMPVVFETGSDLDARLSYNQIAAAQASSVTQPTIDASSTGLQLSGTSTALKAGSTILILGKRRSDGTAAWLYGPVVSVEPSSALGLTLVTWTPPTAPDGGLIGQSLLGTDALTELEVYSFGRQLVPFGHDARPLSSASSAVQIEQSTGGGVSLRDPGWARLLDGLPTRALSALAVGLDGTLWIAGEFGVAYQSKGGAGSWAVAKNGLGSADITTLTVADDGSLWAGSSQGRVYRCQGTGRDWTTVAGGYSLVRTETDNVVQMLPVRADLPRSPVVAIAPHIPAQPKGPSDTSASPDIATVLVANGVGVYGNLFDGVGWYGDNQALTNDFEAKSTPQQANVTLVDLAVLGPKFAITDGGDATVRAGYAIAAAPDELIVFAWYPFDAIASPTGSPAPPTPPSTNPTGPGDTLPGYGTWPLSGVLQLVYFTDASVVDPSGNHPPELLVLTTAGPKHWNLSEFDDANVGLSGAIPIRAAAVPLAAQTDGPLSGFVAVATDGISIWGLASAGRTWTTLPGFSGASGTPTSSPEIAVGIAAGPAGQLLASAPLTFADEWPGFQTITESGSDYVIDTDAKPFALAQGSWVVSAEGRDARVFSLLEAAKAYRSQDAFGQPGQVFRLTLDEPVSAGSSADPGDPRSSVISVASKALDVYETVTVDDSPVAGKQVALAGIIDGFTELAARLNQHTHELRPLAFVGPRVRVCVTVTGGLWTRPDDDGGWTELALASHGVTALATATTGELWVGTESSGARVFTTSSTWEDRSAGIPVEGELPASVTAIACAAVGTFAVIGGRVMRWQTTASWAAVAELANVEALSLLADGDELFVGTKAAGLWRLGAGGRFVLATNAASLGNLELRALASCPLPNFGAAFQLLIATDLGVYRYGTGVERLGVEGPDQFSAVACDGRQLVAGTPSQGLWVLDGVDSRARWRAAGLRFRSINVVRYDPEPSRWAVGSVGAGVYTSTDASDWAWRPLGSPDDILALACDPKTKQLLAGASANVRLVSSSGAPIGELVYSRVLTISEPDADHIAAELGQGFISADLRDAFDRQKVELAADALVATLITDQRWLLSSRDDPSAAIYLVLRDPLHGLIVIEPNTVPTLIGVPTAVAEQPDFETITFSDGDLQGEVLLARAQWINRPPLPDDASASEVKRLVAAGYDYRSDTTTIQLDAALANVYDRASLQVSANVVRASQGESVTNEVLGSGDGGQANQRFTLSRAPLTFLPAPAPVYRRTTLSITVDDLPWTEVDSLHDAGPDAQVYSVTLDHEGRATISFGDGQHGARLPTGTHNVVATYRVGLGEQGDVATGSLNILMSPPPGVASVTNPIPATDGVDPEDRETVRRKLPLSSQTVDRVVTLKDFASVATCYPGVRQAVAKQLKLGATKIVQVTVAFEPRLQAAEYAERSRALDRTLADVQVAPAMPTSTAATVLAYFKLVAEISLAPHYLAADVAPAVIEALYERWSPATANIGETVTQNAIAAIVQAVVGVSGVRVRVLARSDSGFDGLESLTADPAHVSNGKLVPAATLVLDRSARSIPIPVAPEVAVYVEGGVKLLVVPGGEA